MWLEVLLIKFQCGCSDCLLHYIYRGTKRQGCPNADKTILLGRVSKLGKFLYMTEKKTTFTVNLLTVDLRWYNAYSFFFAAAMRMSTFCISNLLLIWKIVIHQGKENPSEILPPQPYNICTIMYTSGTSGDPKGVVLTHETVTLFVRGVDLFMEQFEDKVGEKLIGSSYSLTA